MKSKILILLITFITLGVSKTFAHALWIQTSGTGKKGQLQEVKVFFGEYAENKPDSTQTWFSNMKEFSLLLTAPNGSTTVLKPTASTNFFRANFIPDQDGTYLLSIVHEVADIYDNAKIEYYAYANVMVGNTPQLNQAYPTNAALTIKPEKNALKVGADLTHRTSFNKVPFAKQKVTVINPDRKTITPETDVAGKFIFRPEQKGDYFFEVFKEEKSAGSINGKPYEKIWHVATYFTAIL